MTYVATKDMQSSIFAGLCVMLFMFGICYIPFFSFIVLGYLGYKRYKDKYLVAKVESFLRESESHVVSGVYIGILLVLAVNFVLDVGPIVSSSSFAYVVVAGLSLMTFGLYVACVFMNPGVMTTRALTQERLESILGNGEYLGDLCPVCLIIKPARSKHCSHCKSCIAHYGK